MRPPFDADASAIASPLLLLDGGYCLTTSLSVDELDKESVHARYKDLAMVENAFRTCKTGQLELRPIYAKTRSNMRTCFRCDVIVLVNTNIAGILEHVGHDG
ncbi:MAG: hypothetical protein LBJ00_08190 [Planctomycetaceae bacterium]|nr:hypothetical protein [Planctomycetaceae bacterium]